MKRIALIFMLAVLVPSFVLAWLAIRSARDQQLVFVQQQRMLYQGVAEAISKDVRDFMSERQREFAQMVEALRRDLSSAELAGRFDELARENWGFTEVGFAVTTSGSVLSPSLFGRPEARQFRLNNDRFLCSSEPVQVYWNAGKAVPGKAAAGIGSLSNLTLAGKGIVPGLASNALPKLNPELVSVLEPDEAEFKQLIEGAYEGTVARFLQNRLKVLLWYRSAREPELVYGAQLNLTNLTAQLRELVRAPEEMQPDITVELLDDMGRAISGNAAVARLPFVTSDLGAVLPHWKVAVYLNHPEMLARSSRAVQITLLLTVVTMMAAIVMGGLLLVGDLRRQLTLSRQKTDFVSNVSHELKTPLTSIRMFSELLGGAQVSDEAQRKQFLQIIASEAARLTRLINNVLDFARMERGEKKYHFMECDLAQITRDTVESYRRQLESSGLRVTVHLPARPVKVQGDADALAQVIVNLLSNAEKYAAAGGELDVELTIPDETPATGAPVKLKVLDRGPGVPRGSEEAIFEQFHRAHDSLSSGIPGSGLGLTLARQMARAHGGEVRYEARPGGGSCFLVTLPLKEEAR